VCDKARYSHNHFRFPRRDRLQRGRNEIEKKIYRDREEGKKDKGREKKRKKIGNNE
jgi:hypothetical protein